MTAASHTVTTATTDDMAVSRDKLSRAKIIHIRANIDNMTNKFMANDHRYGNGRLCPAVPIVNMHVRATNSRARYLDQHIVNANFWIGCVF